MNRCARTNVRKKRRSKFHMKSLKIQYLSFSLFIKKTSGCSDFEPFAEVSMHLVVIKYCNWF